MNKNTLFEKDKNKPDAYTQWQEFVSKVIFDLEKHQLLKRLQDLEQKVQKLESKISNV